MRQEATSRRTELGVLGLAIEETLNESGLLGNVLLAELKEGNAPEERIRDLPQVEERTIEELEGKLEEITLGEDEVEEGVQLGTIGFARLGPVSGMNESLR